MAQTVSIMIISDETCECVGLINNIPTEEDVESLACDYDLNGNIECDYVSYNIGEGESHMDTFFSDDELKDIYNSVEDFGEFEDEIEKLGYTIDRYSSGHLSAYVEW